MRELLSLLRRIFALFFSAAGYSEDTHSHTPSQQTPDAAIDLGQMTEEVVSQLDFGLDVVRSGRYDMVAASAQTAALTSTTTSGGEQDSWVLPVGVLNLSRSVLTLKVTPSATAAEAQYVHANTVPIRRIVLTHGSETLADVTNLQEYVNSIALAAQSADDVRLASRAYGAYSAATSNEGVNEGFRLMATPNSDQYQYGISASTVTQATSAELAGWATFIHKDNAYRPAVLSAASNTSTATAYSFELPRDLGKEVTYLYGATSVNESSPIMTYRLRLGQILPGTAFALDKDVPTSSATPMTLTIEYAASSSFVFKSAATTPATGCSAYSGALTISGQRLDVAVQRDEAVIQAVREAARAGRLRYIIDSPVWESRALTGSNQSPSLTIGANRFAAIKCLFAVPYHSTRSGVTAYDHRADEPAAFRKIATIYSTLDSRRLQDQTWVTASADDWVYSRSALKGSIIASSSSVFAYNWVFLVMLGLPELIEAVRTNALMGLDGSVSHTWDITSTQGGSRTLTWFVGAIGSRVYRYDPDQGSLVLA